jgi:hypothetical protein
MEQVCVLRELPLQQNSNECYLYNLPHPTLLEQDEKREGTTSEEELNNATPAALSTYHIIVKLT